jgi:hypothetical protein
MAPVASAAPNDTSNQRRPKPKRRRPNTPKAPDINAGSVIGTMAAERPAVPNGNGEGEGGGGNKRKRRRRKKKKSGSNGVSESRPTGASDSPVDFFSSGGGQLAPTGIPQGPGKKKRRRRRRRGSGKGRPEGAATPESGPSTGPVSE